MDKLNYLLRDILYSSLMMAILAFICAIPAACFWNDILATHLQGIQPIGLWDAFILNFTLNFIFYFKLSKRDVIVANSIQPDEQEVN